MARKQLVQNFIHTETRFFDDEMKRIYSESNFAESMEKHRMKDFHPQDTQSQPVFIVEIFGLSAIHVPID